jgi:ABC-type transport system involved in cytochrome bd biosynthesis fused ATPase/permease subunit
VSRATSVSVCFLAHEVILLAAESAYCQQYKSNAQQKHKYGAQQKKNDRLHDALCVVIASVVVHSCVMYTGAYLQDSTEPLLFTLFRAAATATSVYATDVNISSVWSYCV